MKRLLLFVFCLLLLVACDFNKNVEERFNPGGIPNGGGTGSNADTSSYEFFTSLEKSSYTQSVETVPSVAESSLAKVTISGDKTESVTQDVTSDTLIVLDNLSLDSTGKGLVLKGNYDIYIKLVGSNFISSDKNAIDADDLKGNLYFYGDGSLSLSSASKGGIKAKKSKISIYDGTYDISLPESSGGDGIRCTDFTLYSGKITINALGKLVKASYEDYPGSKGIQAKATTNTNDGNITIYGGEINIKSYGKAITANYGDYTTSATCGNVLIKNGFISVKTIGTPQEDTSSTQEDGISPEGIEAKNTLNISGGVVQVCSTDDSLNGLKLIDISGGYVFGFATQNDCMDSNSKITVSGGIVFLLCVTGGPEKAIDTDIGESRNATFSYTGGTVIAVSKTSSDKPNSGSTAKCVQKTVDVSSTVSIKTGSTEVA